MSLPRNPPTAAANRATEPRDATARFALLEWQVGGIVRVPYVRALRLVDDPVEVVLSGKAQAAVDELRRLVSGGGRGWRR